MGLNLCVRRYLPALLAAALLTGAARGDEGMWLFNNPPKNILKQRYGFEPPASWYEHLQRSSVRFNEGGSGSFISSRGLVLTNHHIGVDSLQKLSTKEKNYVADGFYAKTENDEVKCPDLELNVLMSIEDVTMRVNAAVPPVADLAAAETARRAVMNTIEQEEAKKTGLRRDVITLFQGGQYQLYRYKRYTDVRLVFAPEDSVGNFGGDPDNFDIRATIWTSACSAFTKTAGRRKSSISWSGRRKVRAEGESVFVSGNPARTDRLDTVAHLHYIRDVSLPLTLSWLMCNEVLLSTYGQRSEENMRRCREELFYIQNSRKAELGRLAGLQDPAVMADKLSKQTALRNAVAADGRLRATTASAWDDVAAAIKTLRGIYKDVYLVEEGRAFRCRQFMIVRTLLRLAEEDAKPNADRLREYRSSNRASLEQVLYSPAPIYDDLETIKLADGLSLFVTLAGADNELVRKVLAGKSPRERRRGSDSRHAAERRCRAARARPRRPGRGPRLGRPDGQAGVAGGRSLRGTSAARRSSRLTSRCGRPMRRSRRPASPFPGTKPIRTPPSRSACPSAW